MTANPHMIAKRRSSVLLRTVAVVGLATSLAGCYSSQQVAQAPYPTEYRERHPITIKQGEQTTEIFLGRNRGGLTPDQRADVLAFAQVWRHEATSGVIIDVPQGGSIDRAARVTLHEVRSILAAAGVPRNAVYVRGYRPWGSSLASIRLNYTKLVAQAGPCGLWPHDLGVSEKVYTENGQYWNFGCSYQRNLAAMVDNPADLVQPRGETPAYAARHSVAIDKYRKGENPSGTYNGYDKGKISDLGK